MMKEYRVERMTVDNYERMMAGSHYDKETIVVMAQNKAHAIKVAKNYGYIVNKGYVRTVEEVE